MPNLTLLKGGLVVDGSGRESYPADVLIEGGVIREIGAMPEALDAKELDCRGLVIAPGFIDAHSHSDLQVLSNKTEKVLQGVTAEVVGNCGFSAYPNTHASALREFGNGILCGDGDWGWPSASAYLLDVHSKARLASVFSLVGHGSLRIAHAGPQQGPTDEETLQQMEGTLDEALADGATGFSTGLMYAPGSSAPKEEIERLCRVTAKRGKIYCTHMRDYSTRLLEAIDEQIELARTTGCRLQISHLQTVGRVNWRLNSIALERMEQARRSGVDVMFDCYPYLAGSTVLTQMLPQWTLEGGSAKLIARLTDPGTAAEIREQTMDALVHQWSDIFISGVKSEKNAGAVGKSIEELSRERQEEPFQVIVNLLVEEDAAVNMLQFNQNEPNLRANLSHPLSLIISDGFYVKGKPHPRLHGTFPELLGNICREKGWLSLEDAIHKVTGAPADRFSMKRRGLLRAGYWADIAIFDYAKVRSNATYRQPELKPEGVIGVMRQGEMIFGGRECDFRR